MSLLSFVAKHGATARTCRAGVADRFITKCAVLCADFDRLLLIIPIP
ncbi:hypothetical protein PAMC26510_28510 [Caballeronia sordidicola]|uniref:Uncharacterized protein n=1 Tax=Caballeronia sordidicola TaxID=196367 RepID=A0A242MC52_CABSO|nr:hypothetical protein PAMC26510_28510 [Caballeronia sordidicola]OTP71894.1 hypothetical protein PAMC26577_23315 [Caballeronia sordidicola]